MDLNTVEKYKSIYSLSGIDSGLWHRYTNRRCSPGCRGNRSACPTFSANLTGPTCPTCPTCPTGSDKIKGTLQKP